MSAAGPACGHRTCIRRPWENCFLLRASAGDDMCSHTGTYEVESYRKRSRWQPCLSVLRLVAFVRACGQHAPFGVNLHIVKQLRKFWRVRGS